MVVRPDRMPLVCLATDFEGAPPSIDSRGVLITMPSFETLPRGVSIGCLLEKLAWLSDTNMSALSLLAVVDPSGALRAQETQHRCLWVAGYGNASTVCAVDLLYKYKHMRRLQCKAVQALDVPLILPHTGRAQLPSLPAAANEFMMRDAFLRSNTQALCHVTGLALALHWSAEAPVLLALSGT